MTGRLRPSVKAAPALLVPLLVHSCIQLMFARCLPGRASPQDNSLQRSCSV